MNTNEPDPTRRWILLGVVLGLCAVILNPASQATAGPAKDKDDRFITAETSGILDIEGGECFSDPAYSPGAGEPVVLYTPCAQGADNQSYGFVHAEDGPFDRTGLAEFGWDRCGHGFRVNWPKSTLDYYPILPTEETWADGDRDLMCVVYDPEGRLPDSVLPLR
jgi:hypothetical protein